MAVKFPALDAGINRFDAHDYTEGGVTHCVIGSGGRWQSREAARHSSAASSGFANARWLSRACRSYHASIVIVQAFLAGKLSEGWSIGD